MCFGLRTHIKLNIRCFVRQLVVEINMNPFYLRLHFRKAIFKMIDVLFQETSLMTLVNKSVDN